MGIKTVVQESAKRVFDYLSDVTITLTYHSTAAETDVDNDGNPILVDLITLSNVRALVNMYSQEELMNPNIETRDRKCTILAADLPAVTPKQDDYLTISARDWDIVNIRTDITNSLHIFQIR